MQTNNRLFDDIARMASGAVNTLSGVRGEVELRVRERLERALAEMDLVTREEFEAARAMAVAARDEQEALAARLAALETELVTLRAAGRPAPAATGPVEETSPVEVAAADGTATGQVEVASPDPEAPDAAFPAQPPRDIP